MTATHAHFKTSIDQRTLDSQDPLVVTQKALLLIARQTFGACAVGSYIYIGGGYDQWNRNTDQVDRYDVLRDLWETLPNCKLPFPLNSHTFITVRNRYIYSVGNEMPPAIAVDKTEVIFRLDTFNLQLGWTDAWVACGHEQRGVQYGIMHMGDSKDWRDKSTFIVFGGEALSNGKLLKRTSLFEFSNKDIEKTTIGQLRAKHELECEPQDIEKLKDQSDFEELTVKDRFYFAQYFPIKESQLSENFLDIHVLSEKKR